MISSSAAHPNCAYKWLDYITSPRVNAQVAEYYGEAPANSKACAYTTDRDFCARYNADNENYWKSIYYWSTPTVDCHDSRARLHRLRDVDQGLDRHQGLSVRPSGERNGGPCLTATEPAE